VIQPDHDDIEILLRKYHTFWSTAIAFLTAKRTVDDVEALDRCWSQCKCAYTHDTTAAKLHMVVNSMLEWVTTFGRYGGLGLLVDNLVMTFTITVDAVKTVSVAKGRHPELWPASPKDLMPNGPETTVESIIVLARFMDDATVFALLSFFMRICRSLIIPSVVSSPSVCKYIAERGLQACNAVSSAPLTRNGQVEDSIANMFCHDMMSIASFSRICAQWLPAQIKQFHLGFEKDTFVFFSRAVEIMESSVIPIRYKVNMEPFREGFAAHAGILHMLFPKNMPKGRLYPTIRTVIDIIVILQLSLLGT
jgi:hypothetical protein